MPGSINHRAACLPLLKQIARAGYAVALGGKAPELLSPQRLAAIGADRHMLITAHHAGDDRHPVAHALSTAVVPATQPRRAGFR